MRRTCVIGARTGKMAPVTDGSGLDATTPQRRLTEAREAGDRQAEGQALHDLGKAELAEGRSDGALNYFREALAIFRDLEELAEQQVVLNDLGNVLRDLGSRNLDQTLTDEAIKCFGEAYNITVQLDPFGSREMAISLINLGLGHYDKRDWDVAMAYFNDAMSLLGQLDDRQLIGVTLTYIGAVQEAKIRFNEAIETLEQSLVIHRELGNSYAEAEALAILGRIYQKSDRFDEVLRCYERSRAIYREHGDRYNEARIDVNIGMALVSLGDKTAARSQYLRALDVFETMNAPEAANVHALLNTLKAFS